MTATSGIVVPLFQRHLVLVPKTQVQGQLAASQKSSTRSLVMAEVCCAPQAELLAADAAKFLDSRL